MPERLVYWNGDFIPEREARLSVFDWALMYGDMLFEMTRTFAGKPFRPREHLERLYGSLRYAEIDCGLTIDEMEAATIETMQRNDDRLGGEFGDGCSPLLQRTATTPLTDCLTFGVHFRSPPGS